MKINAKGFTAVEGLLILIIVGIIGFAGWKVWDTSKSDTNSSSGNQTEQSRNPNAERETAPESSVEDAEYLEIKELGIRFKTTEATNDLVYIVKTDSSGISALFSSSSLLKVDDKCTAESGPLGAFRKITGGYQAQKSPGKLVKQFDAFHIVHTPMQGCPNGLEEQVNAVFQSQSRAIQDGALYSSVVEI
jgi:hypothetical protein